MANVYLCGHGEWSKSGFASVPKNTTVRVYTPVGRYLALGQAGQIMRGAAGALASDQYFKQFESVTDLTLYPAPEFAAQFAAAGVGANGQMVMVSVATQLSELLKTYAGNDLHWLACRVRFAGKDTTQGGLNEDYQPATGMGTTVMAANPDTIRSTQVGSNVPVAPVLDDLSSNPAFNRAKHRAGL